MAIFGVGQDTWRDLPLLEVLPKSGYIHHSSISFAKAKRADPRELPLRSEDVSQSVDR
jgi:hypothetical protein